MAPPPVTLFTRPGCTLCDAVKFVIRKVGQKHPLHYSEVDISEPAHSRWLAAYATDIPVVHVHGSEIARHRLSESVLVRALQQQRQPTAATEPHATHS